MLRSAVVLGATQVIGRGVVRALLGAGRPVIAVAQDAAGLEELSTAHAGADLAVLASSVITDADASRLAAALVRLARPIDAVVVAPSDEPGRGRLLDHPTRQLQQLLNREVLAQLAAARQLLPLIADTSHGGRYVLIGGPGSDRPWAGYGYRSVAAAALAMLARVLHDEARSLAVRVQLLSIDSPVCGEPRRPHDGTLWPRPVAIGERVVALLDRDTASEPARAIVRVSPGVDSSAVRSTSTGPGVQDMRSFLKSLTTRNLNEVFPDDNA